MKRCTRLVTLLMLSTPLWAIEPSYTQCTTSDSEGKQWVIKNIYQRAAKAKAFDACKKQSNDPGSCKTDCEEFIHGVSTRPSWQCTALDQNAKAWVSNSYPDRDNAAIAAKDDCMKHSSIPDTCYLNLNTCRNLNHWP